MNPSVRICLVIHNHQPVGNFDSVIEQAYQDSYLPFLDVFEEFEHLKLSLHTSGPLMNWLEEHHQEYLDRIASLVHQGRVEIVGGPYYEPILTMIPSRDRIGQIRSYSDWLEQRFDTSVNGMWMPERVWEQSLTSDIAAADIRYTVLDDFHFGNAGLDKDSLGGFFVTEDQGRMLTIFPGSEELRYLIPFRPVEETIDHLRSLAEQQPGRIVVFGDDGEKFGTWPNTREHVYEKGWLHELFSSLTKNRDWIHTARLEDCIRDCEPEGKVFIPDSSYREMTEWSLPVEKQLELDRLKHRFEEDEDFQLAEQFISGGFWRNFKIRYPETNDMYARMMYVSMLLQQADQEGRDPELVEEARQDLYRGQCNCAYWHGAFGGIYLPHLRNAVFRHLIAAENRLEQANKRPAMWVEATADDYNFDGRQEIRLANDQLSTWISPAMGGQMYGFDIRSAEHNLLATINRKPEAYHEKVRGGETDADDQAASIHDRVVFKQEGLDQKLQYDSGRRVSLIDHFHDNDTELQSIISGQAMERGDFATGHYDAIMRRNEDRVQVMMSKAGNAWGCPLKITKGVTMNAGSNVIEIAYFIEGLPPESLFHFSVEFNFAGMPSNADGRYFYNDQCGNFGHLGSRLELHDIRNFNLVDQWQGIDVGFDINRPTSMWTFPIESVSQSEAGFELVHQSVVVQPHWWIRPNEEGNWTVTMRLMAAGDLDHPFGRQAVESLELAAV
ncbi:MAG: alpha-amylase/4-alpha-glucanotransferase domain-containing protein [Planctomycetota bacterium]|nr:alpha-amylase/4-alpha-glucanotransferase domain-containing protein [Planctomycetota bacterium]